MFFSAELKNMPAIAGLLITYLSIYRAYAKKKMLFLLQRFLHTSLWGDGKRNLIKTKTNNIQPAPASSLAITTEDQNNAMQENEKSKPKQKVNKQMSVSYLPSVY